jgi:hypothetical protein
MNIMKSRAVHLTRTITASSIAALALSVALVAPQAASADEALTALNDESLLFLATLDLSRTPLGESSVIADSGEVIAHKLQVFEDNLDDLGDSSQVNIPAAGDGDQLSTYAVYNQAKLAYDTLLTRCEAMRDNAGPNEGPDGRADETSVGLRINALELATQQQATPTVGLGRPTEALAAEYLDAFNAMKDILQAENYVLGDPTSDTYEYDLYDLNLAVQDIYSRVLEACPAN